MLLFNTKATLSQNYEKGDYLKKAQILWIARSYATPLEGVKKHMHPYYHMIHIVKGTLRFVIDDKTFFLSPGHCLLIPRNTNHAYFNDGNDSVEYLEIKFSLLKSAFESQIVRRKIQITNNELAGNLFKQILKEYSSFDNRADDAAEAYLLALLNLLGENERCQAKQQFRYLAASDYLELSQSIIRYLEEHYYEELSLESLAKAMNRNKSYLCVAFKKDTQLTILDCLNTIRIRHAAELIVYSEYNLTQVAEACGFASVSHFNRVFLKYVGITPGKCRRAYPVDVLITPENVNEIESNNNFMYSVLAQKLISPQMIKNSASLKVE